MLSIVFTESCQFFQRDREPPFLKGLLGYALHSGLTRLVVWISYDLCFGFERILIICTGLSFGLTKRNYIYNTIV